MHEVGFFPRAGHRVWCPRGLQTVELREAPTQGPPRQRAQQPKNESSASKQKLKEKLAVHLLECLWLNNGSRLAPLGVSSQLME